MPRILLLATLALAMTTCRPQYDPCASKKCGDRCQMCPPDDATCMETQELKFCNASLRCVASAEPPSCK